MPSDREWCLKTINKLRSDICNKRGCPELDLADVLYLVCEKLMDDVERCGCPRNYPKGSCVECECPTCHKTK